MDLNLSQIIDQVGKDKGVDKEILIAALEEAMVTAARRKLGLKEGVEAQFNPEAGEVEVFQYKEVTDEVEDPQTQLSLEEARALDPEAEVGDLLGMKVDTSDFGRIAAQTAKQVIIQRVKDAERENVYMAYKDRRGEIVNGIVQRFERGDIIVNLGRVEAMLSKSEQVPRESYKPGDRLRAMILDVRRAQRGTQIVLSRTHPEFMTRMFEMEVPEISERIVEIHNAAREPGERAKIAVLSNDLDVDPVGACVGMRGSRVQSVVQELRGERIDIIPWSPDPAKFVCSALSPAEISRVIVDEENKSMEVIVPDDQLSLAIGRRGQNVRLASKLSGWRLDVLSESRAAERNEEARESLSAIPGVGEMIVEILFMEGYRSAEDIAQTTLEELSNIEGIGEAKAESLIVSARELIERKQAEKEAAALTVDALLGSHDGIDIEEDTIALLQADEVFTLNDLMEFDEEKISAIDGIEPEKAKILLKVARDLMGKQPTEQPADIETPPAEKTESDLSRISGIGAHTIELLSLHGIESIEQLANTKAKDLMRIPGIGDKKAHNLAQSAQSALESMGELQMESTDSASQDSDDES